MKFPYLYYKEKNIKIYCGDCLSIMKTMPDKNIDLVVTDPPYGLNIAKTGSLSIKGSSSKKNIFAISDWDKNKPSKKYFTELLRVSKNQIIWGGGYFIEYLFSSRCWLVWYKRYKLPPQTFADCELAWTSFNKPAMVFNCRQHGYIRDSKEKKEKHPTQKALLVIERCITEFSKNKNDIILDPFLGSGTTLVACKKIGRKGIGIEINKEYCDMAVKRLKNLKMED